MNQKRFYEELIDKREKEILQLLAQSNALEAEVARLRNAIISYETWRRIFLEENDTSAFVRGESALLKALAAMPDDNKRWAEVREQAVKVATAAETLKNLQPEKPH